MRSTTKTVPLNRLQSSWVVTLDDVAITPLRQKSWGFPNLNQRQRFEQAPDSMPRLEREAPEYQVLAAIKFNLAPLIEKRVSDDISSERIKHQAVCHAIHVLKYEIDQIPLWLVTGLDISERDYESFLDGLHRLLVSLEALIDERVLRPTISPTSLDNQNSAFPPGLHEHQTASERAPHGTVPPEQLFREGFSILKYPKIEALVNRALKGSSSLDLATLLALPKTIAEAMKVTKVVTNFNTDNRARFDAAILRNSGNIKSAMSDLHMGGHEPIPKFELEDVKQWQNHFSELWNALTENITLSECASNHTAKLQIRYPEISPYSSHENQHNIFISCCSAQHMWQETTCRIVPHLPQNPRLRHVRNICKVIQGSLDNGRTLEILLHEGRIVRDLDAARLAKLPPVYPTISLDSMLNDIGQDLRRYYKIILSLNLSYALLQMYHSGLQTVWTSRDIFFLFDQTSLKINEAYNPYLVYPLLQHQVSADSCCGNSRKFPLLVAFGKLLLEIALGEPVDDSMLHHRADISLLATISERSEELDELIPPRYVNAMATCLEANQDDGFDDGDMEDFQEVDQESQCRDILLAVVKELELARKELPSRNKSPREAAWRGPNYPLKLKLSNHIQSETPLTIFQEPQTPNSEIPKPPAVPAPKPTTVCIRSRSQLFDDRRQHITATDPRSISAKIFFDLAKAFHDNNISHLPCHSRIRIAILDTGVDESNSFFRGLKKGRVKKDTPFKESRSFVGGPQIDECGHGTNVAALLLRIAPEADLYIAKISREMESSETDQIVQAIKWAQNLRVHIMSISFGLSEENFPIAKAIGDAENEGTIIFAAASNYGGNTGRAFPASMDKVLCVHASDGYGNASGLDPSPITFCENFSTLGVGIESLLEDDVYLSGTSYSTPVAAGFAANVLQYVQTSSLLDRKQAKKAFTREGMKNIFLAMSDTRAGYHYVTPWRKLWNGDGSDEVASRIKEALRYHR